MNTYTSVHDATAISAQKHIIEGAGGKPVYVTTFVIQTDDGKIEIRAYADKNLIVDFKETVIDNDF